MNKEQTLGMSFTPDQCGSAIECVTKKEALEAMDIYAKQEAIEFFKWTESNLDEDGMYNGELKPDEELYNLFLEQR